MCVVMNQIRPMKKNILLAVLVFASSASVFGGGELSISPDGIGPAEALARIRQARQGGDCGEWTVRVAKGRYTLTEPLVFTPADSGIRWIGESGVAFSGGTVIGGWQEADGVWETAIPQDADGNPIWFDSLYANGRRLQRVRWPKEGPMPWYSQYEHVMTAVTNATTGTVAYERRGRLAYTNDAINAHLAALTLGQLVRVQGRACWKWRYESRQIRAFKDGVMEFFASSPDGFSEFETFARPGDMSVHNEVPRIWFENIPSVPLAPGEWVWDVATKTLRYRPQAGEKIGELEFLAPVRHLRSLVRFEGDLAANRPVTDISFENIGFELTVANGADVTPEGVTQTTGTQAAKRTGGAIWGEGLERIRFENCRVSNTENYGFFFERGAVSNVIAKCELTNMGAGGIWIGDIRGNILKNPAYDRTKKPWSKENAAPTKVILWGDPETVKFRTGAFNEITDCTIAHAGYFNPEGAGIVLTHVSDSKVLRNHVFDLFYTGISVGWTWGYGGSVAQRNVIAGNDIHDIGHKLMADMGGIYTLGASFGTVIASNAVHGIKSASYGGWGLYNDEGSEGILWEGNEVYDTNDSCYHQHYGRNNVVRGNRFSAWSQAAIKITRSEDHLSVTFEDNVIEIGTWIPFYCNYDTDRFPKVVWRNNRITVPGAVEKSDADSGFVFISPQGEWKATVERDEHGASSFAGSFVNAKAVTRAVADVTALGAFEFYVNGALVSTSAGEDRADFLRPGFTDPWRRRVYLSYDVTGSWRKGAKEKNDLGAFVATSWFSDGVAGRPDVKSAFAARVRVTYADGTSETFATGPDWKASFESPFVRAAIYGGEIFDARKAALPGTFAAASRTAEINTNFTGVVSPHEGAEVYLRRDLVRKPSAAWVYREVEGASGTNAFGRVKILRRFATDEKMSLAKGETLVVDFGQNMAAVPEFVARATAGTCLTFKGGEMLNDANGEVSRGNDGPAGSVYRANYRSLQGDGGALVRYVFAGTGAEKYLPTFTFLGFRYAAITATGPVEIESLRAIPVTSIGRAMERGTLTTGNRDVNQLISNCRWGQYSNYLSVPTDCPQRDERLGWTADTQVFTAAAFRNADVYAFLSKWMTDMRDGQLNGTFPSVAPLSRWGDCGRNRLGWADAGVIVPWTCWRMTGDKAIIEQNWDAMEAFLATQDHNRYISWDSYQFGDWVAYEQITDKGYWSEDGIRDEAVKYWDFLGGCYWYWNARRMAEMAAVIGKGEKAVKGYDAVARKARRYLKSYFFEEDGGLLKIFRHLQTAALFALKLDLYDSADAKDAAIKGLLKNFADHGDCLQTGFLGTSILMDAVTYGANNPKMAYTLLLQHKNPSWLYSVDQGATTIWERWNSYVKDTGFGDVAMNSFNHYAYGAVLDWMYGTMAGIQPGPEGGFDTSFVLAPIPDERIGSVEATYRTSKGVIKSAWKYENGVCRWTFSVPEGSRAVVRVNGTETEYGPGERTVELTDGSSARSAR